MSGIIAVYALVVAVLIAGDMGPPPGQTYALFNGFMHLACGLSVGLSGVAAGYAIGVVGDMVRAHLCESMGYFADKPRVYDHICNSLVYSSAWF